MAGQDDQRGTVGGERWGAAPEGRRDADAGEGARWAGEGAGWAGEGAGWAGEGAGCRHRSQSPGTLQPLTVLQRPRPPRTALGRPHGTHRWGSRWRHAPENRARPGDPGVDSMRGPLGWGWSSVAAGVKGQGGQGRGQAGSSSCSLHTNPPDHSGETALVPLAWRPQAPPHVSPGPLTLAPHAQQGPVPRVSALGFSGRGNDPPHNHAPLSAFLQVF